MNRTLKLVLVAAWTSPVAAQTADPAVSAMRSEWEMTATLLRKAAEQMSDADFAFRPVATVRTTAQIFGHIADTQFSVCAAALGERNISDGHIEESVSSRKELLVKLQQSMDYCSKAYNQNISAISAQRGEREIRYGALAHNTAHNGEHYGNIATYMRMRGLVPPSSQR